MKDKNQYLESIHEIRSIMERSSKFMSLSGLSGIAAGITAIISGTIACLYLGSVTIGAPSPDYPLDLQTTLQPGPLTFFMLLATATILVAVTLAFLFTRRNAKRKHLPVWDKTAKLVTINMLIPLVTGGLAILVLVFKYGLYELAAPLTLVFYGLALVNAGKYTVSQTQWLGLAEIIAGLTALLFVRYGLLFWIIGFGVFHILYGLVLYTSFEMIHEKKPHKVSE